MDTHSNIIQWLLEENNSCVRYRTLKEILNYNDDAPEMVKAKSEILQSQPVRTLLEKMHPDGYWLQKNPRTQSMAGEGVEYGSFGTTHFCLAYLSEMGLDRTQPQVEKAAERYLALQQPDGDWFRHFSCLLGYNIRTFIRLGFQEDKRVRQSMDLLDLTDRKDGGFLCDIHEGKNKTHSAKSCFRGSVKVLLAYSVFPLYWERPRCKQLVNYFLSRGGIFKSDCPGIPVNKDVQVLSFPITWRANSYEVLYALSKMGYGRDERLGVAWTALDNHTDMAGRYRLDWTPTQCPWMVGKRGDQNKWITFYAEAAKRNNAQTIIN
jgi:hypothetical protein